MWAITTGGQIVGAGKSSGKSSGLANRRAVVVADFVALRSRRFFFRGAKIVPAKFQTGKIRSVFFSQQKTVVGVYALCRRSGWQCSFQCSIFFLRWIFRDKIFTEFFASEILRVDFSRRRRKNFCRNFFLPTAVLFRRREGGGGGRASPSAPLVWRL